MARAEEWIKEGAAQYLEPGEEVLAAFVAAPRGYTQSVAGVSSVGEGQMDRAAEGAEQAGFRLEAPMGIALTPKRLLGLSVSNPVGMGIGGKVTGLLSAVPIEDVDAVEVKRLLMGSRITLTIRGEAFKLEAGAGAKAKPLAEAFRSLKGA